MQRRFQAWFTDAQWTPLVPTLADGVYATAWETEAGVLWTLVNRTEADVTGPLLTRPRRTGWRWFDLITGVELTAAAVGIVKE